MSIPEPDTPTPHGGSRTDPDVDLASAGEAPPDADTLDEATADVLNGAETPPTDESQAPGDTATGTVADGGANEVEPGPADVSAGIGTAADEGTAVAAADDEALDVVTDEELIEQPVRVESPYDRPGRWFVVHTQSGYEKKVKQNLEARIVSMNAEEAIYEVVIPMEDYVDYRNGKRVMAQRKMFPGYLLVRANLDDTAWFVIRNTPGVTGFVGQGAKPSPLPRRDVEAFLMPKGTDEQVATRAKPRLEYEVGETVRVKEGPFADFSGEVIDINEDQLRLKVLVNIFGRETPVELEFSQVAKL
jgi:transcription termination/antitermination protein NusG